jgi:hypothetical protein
MKEGTSGSGECGRGREAERDTRPQIGFEGLPSSYDESPKPIIELTPDSKRRVYRRNNIQLAQKFCTVQNEGLIENPLSPISNDSICR